MIRRLYRLWPHPGLMVRVWLMTAVLAVLQGLLLGLLIPILRAVLRPEPDFAAAAPWLVVGGLGLALYAVLSVVATPLGFTASMKLAEQLRHHLMRHVTTLPLGWFTSDRKATFVRTVTNVTGVLSQLTVTVAAPAITCVLVPVTVIGVTFAVDWRLALVLLATLPLALAVMRVSRRTVARVSVDMEIAANEVAGRAIEFGQAQPVLRAAGTSSTGSARMREALDDHRSQYRRGLDRMLFPDLSYSGVVMIGYVVVLVLGVQFLLSGTLSVADSLALLILAIRFLEPLGAMIDHASGIGAMDYLAERVEKVLRIPALPHHPNPVRSLRSADIEFSRVTFSYGDTPALTDVSFRCRPGTTTALVGPSGSGKTTITRLVARFFDVDSGSVLVGGVDVRELDHPVLLNDVAIVFQDVYLFDTTIEENLRLARPEASRAELEEAARNARLDEVIERLPAGWRTRVGEGGTQLSGGERQRVSIARAFLKRARVVLIDEAASALDPENESAVSQAIANLSVDPERTVIVIAHRPGTLATADQVVALDRGRIAEVGTPADLRNTGGIFSRLYDQYEHARSWRITS
ncbi:ABC transporter ATP-binding protein [Actinoalloteichus sp. AHMU CJ021]|uniref:ATP-binding cassette, subfamily B n=4 Tax=Pseudonocardiaceae TaxID=2070 RepID=A0ABT1JPD6_ACTCY|nr:ABC transporter ATP-binding protein [Actinoalloteichus spitiensis]AUS79934.1 ABC transporter ATP-binding protein [Actinoalloteichus sp. AHMU CJ021]MCP2334114.1 ATP-binding cassette, subfamily B [Actinoalloteichus caeruleus DSM 43889]